MECIVVFLWSNWSTLSMWPRLGSCTIILGSLSNNEGNSNEDGKKAIGLDWQNNNFARASHFLYISWPSLHDCNVKVPNFMFCWGHEHKTTTFLFFSWTLIYSLSEFNCKQICQHLTNWMSWNKCDEVWSSQNSLFKWCFRSHCRPCCLSSIMILLKAFKIAKFWCFGFYCFVF